jgi:hypothetical protein
MPTDEFSIVEWCSEGKGIKFYVDTPEEYGGSEYPYIHIDILFTDKSDMVSEYDPNSVSCVDGVDSKWLLAINPEQAKRLAHRLLACLADY